MTHGYAGNLAHAVLLAVDRPAAAAGQIINCGDDRQFSIRQVVEIIKPTRWKHHFEIISLPSAVAYPARGISLEITPHHKLMDLHKIRQELGYRRPDTAGGSAAAHCALAIRASCWNGGGELEQRLQDNFDYEAENALAAIYREAATRAQAFHREMVPTPHPYPHPKEPGLVRDHRNR